MNNKLKDIYIKYGTYYFFDDIKNLDPNKIKIFENSCKNILIYYIGYVTFRDFRCAKINIVNPLYRFINKINGSFEKINGNKYLILVSTAGSKDTLKRYE